MGISEGSAQPVAWCAGKVAIKDGIKCDSSKAILDGAYVGLACDEVNSWESTESMMDKWIVQLKAEGAA